MTSRPHDQAVSIKRALEIQETRRRVAESCIKKAAMDADNWREVIADASEKSKRLAQRLEALKREDKRGVERALRVFRTDA